MKIMFLSATTMVVTAAETVVLITAVIKHCTMNHVCLNVAASMGTIVYSQIKAV